jgi:hypothetical protein
MDYTSVSLADVRAGLDNLAREVQATFGALDARQLNWRPGTTQWSVAQCFEHLIKMNRLMFQAAEIALNEQSPRTIWQRLPGVPGVLGRLMIRSQAPEATRKYSAPAPGQPSSSDIGADVVQRFVEQLRDAVARLNTLAESDAARIIMVSPFIKVVTYSVLDSWRLVFAHGRRHVEQARRVTLAPGFPR